VKKKMLHWAMPSRLPWPNPDEGCSQFCISTAARVGGIQMRLGHRASCSAVVCVRRARVASDKGCDDGGHDCFVTYTPVMLVTRPAPAA